MSTGESPCGPVGELARRLVRIDTTNPPGNERPAVGLLAGILGGAGFEIETRSYLDSAERTQLVARLRGTGSRPGVLFSGHVDVVPPGNVPWSVPPFAGELRNGRLYGRGSCDMKGGVAALVVAATRLAAGRKLEGDLVVAVTADEERNCLGAEALVEEPLFEGLGSAIVAEPTSLGLYVAEKGAFWLEITALGKTAHGSMPHLGANAVAAVAELLVQWERQYPSDAAPHPLLGSPTLTAGVIQGGVKVNVVPDRCAVQLDMRTVPGVEHSWLRAEMDTLLAEISGARPGIRWGVATLSDRPAVECPADSPLARALSGAIRQVKGEEPQPRGVPYCTEACIWVPRLGIPAVICGPGEPGMCHQPDEFVDLKELELAAEIYTRAVEGLLAAA
jgi:succinyl-diaminopimelate desuccinylase